MKRLRLTLRGTVQGVGFRPHVYRVATELGLAGWVKNDGRGVVLEVEGPSGAVGRFVAAVTREVSYPAHVDDHQQEALAPTGEAGFKILASDPGGAREATILADMAPCQACLAELLEPTNRRYRYPFINCTHCGPRYTIIRAVPYDRPNTTMAAFVQCPACQREYDDPTSRRFHAQPNACPRCGPQLCLLDASGTRLAHAEEALAGAVRRIADGQVIAIEGVGGFQLLVDARSDHAVERLRNRKHRREKPLAVMVKDHAAAAEIAELSPVERGLLESPEAPIVLLNRRRDAPLSAAVAPGNPRLGVMLPSSPLHHILTRDLGFPIVATSGNLSEEPICISEEEARARLRGIADAFLVHDRPIQRHADDSIGQIVNGEVRLLRRARGYAPLPVLLPHRMPAVLAVGGHQKNTIALLVGDRAILSQHIGDLDTHETRHTCGRVIADLLHVYQASPIAVAHDLHPDYASTVIAEQLTAAGGKLEGVPLIAVQHHHAHLVACLADNRVHGEEVLGIIWDGTGYGPDGTIWGGEFLVGNESGYERLGCLEPFPLPGGDSAIRSPRRVALGLLHHFCASPHPTDNDGFAWVPASPRERALMPRQLALSPRTSSIGRLFDAVASILGLIHESQFEGQAAMAVEYAAALSVTEAYPLPVVAATPRALGSLPTPAPSERVRSDPTWWLNPRPLLSAILEDRERGVNVGVISARFHGALVEATLRMAEKAQRNTVVLSGGCFQNVLLLGQCRRRLESAGYRVLVHHQLPPNDGGLSVGQAIVAACVAAVT